MTTDPTAATPQMNPTELYREEIFTDRKVGTIRQLIPVRPDGKTDPGRQLVFVGQAQLLTAVGTVPLTFEIEASSLEQAVEGFAEAAQQAVERTVDDLEQLRREAASSIIIPEPGAGGLGGPGSGKIQLK